MLVFLPFLKRFTTSLPDSERCGGTHFVVTGDPIPKPTILALPLLRLLCRVQLYCVMLQVRIAPPHMEAI